MKKIIGALIALYSAFAFCATTVPVQLLNPTGSTAGQTIVSQGASAVPAWSNLTAANVTGAAATSGTLAQFAATTSAQLAGVVSDETGSGVLVFGTSPTLTTPNIVGVTNGGAAAAGSVGQIITATATAVSLSSGVAANATSISLTAGQWDVYGSCRFIAAGTTVVSNVFAGASTTSATFPTSPLFAVFQTSTPSNFTGSALGLTIPSQPFNVSTTTTVFLVVQSAFATSTMTVDCNLWGERRR